MKKNTFISRTVSYVKLFDGWSKLNNVIHTEPFQLKLAKSIIEHFKLELVLNVTQANHLRRDRFTALQLSNGRSSCSMFSTLGSGNLLN